MARKRKATKAKQPSKTRKRTIKGGGPFQDLLNVNWQPMQTQYTQWKSTQPPGTGGRLIRGRGVAGKVAAVTAGVGAAGLAALLAARPEIGAATIALLGNYF